MMAVCLLLACASTVRSEELPRPAAEGEELVGTLVRGVLHRAATISTVSGVPSVVASSLAPGYAKCGNGSTNLGILLGSRGICPDPGNCPCTGSTWKTTPIASNRLTMTTVLDLII